MGPLYKGAVVFWTYLNRKPDLENRCSGFGLFWDPKEQSGRGRSQKRRKPKHRREAPGRGVGRMHRSSDMK